MISITYLSTKDREDLVFLQDSLISASGDLTTDITSKIREIETRRKALATLSVAECEDLQSQLQHQMQLAQQTRKSNLVRNVQNMMLQLSARYEVIANEEANLANKQITTESEKARYKRLTSLLGKLSNDKRSKQSGGGSGGTPAPTNPWNISLDSDD